jgi:hypothetical protein
MKDIELNFTERGVSMIAKLWDDFALEDEQRVFEEWTTHIEWVIANTGEYPGIPAFRNRHSVPVAVSQRPFVSGRPSSRL